MKLSSNARNALRNAITNHANWDKAFRLAHNYSLATMSRNDFIECANKLGIDIHSVINNADKANSSKANEAKDAFDRAPDEKADAKDDAHSKLAAHLTRSLPSLTRENDKEFAQSLLNGFARYGTFTDRQLPHVRRLITKAEEAHDMSDSKSFDTEDKRTPDTHGDDKLAKLARMLADVVSNSINTDDVRTIVKEELSRFEFKGQSHVIELRKSNVKIGEIKGAHPKFRTILAMAQCRNGDGFVPGIFLPGPAGSGKTFAVKQVAKALDMPFHFNGSIGMAHELLGFIDANGCYHRTPFRDAYENGGVYLFDEVDGSDNAAILALNAALAGDCATFPDGQVIRHPDFVPMATANTWGMGANADYVGRAKLDGAFLDRFPGRVFWDYDNVLECAISGNQEFAERVQRARAKARELGLKVLITPRASMAGAAYIAGGMSHDEAAQVTYLANLTPDQRAMLGE